MTAIGIGTEGASGGFPPTAPHRGWVGRGRPLVAASLASLWTATLVLYPVALDVAPSAGEDSPRAAGEGLYKSAPETKANFGMLGVRLYQANEGKKRWAIRSEFAELHRKENYSFLQTVEAEFIAGRTGNVVTTKSRYGRAQLDKQNVDLEGDVNIRSKKGYLFTMERLHYDGGAHIFTSEDQVRMLGPDVAKPRMYLRGTGLMAEIDNEHFYLRKNVTAQRRLGAGAAAAKAEDAGWLRVTSRSGEFFTEEQRSIFISKVRAHLPKLDLESDVLELSLASDKESMHAQGNVVMHSRDRVGRADTAHLELGTNRIVLEGKARVDSKDNQVRGRRILLFTDEDRIEVEEAEGKGQG